MEQLKRTILKILFPKGVWVFLSVPLAAGFLLYAFLIAGESSPVTYPVYVFSAYALTIVCAWLIRNLKDAVRNVEQRLHGVPIIHRYLTDTSFKLHMSLYLSFSISVFYAGSKFLVGMYYQSVWLVTLAVYYVLLAVMRFWLLDYANKNNFGKAILLEWRQYRRCGGFLLLMNIVLSGVVILMVRKNEGFTYPGYLIYVVAMYAFYMIILAVTNVVKYRKFKSPAMSAAKVVTLVSTMVSMLALETAMVSQFGTENPEIFRKVMTGTTGGCLCCTVLGMAIYMIWRATKEINHLKL